MEFMLATGDHGGVAVHILNLYFVLADAALSFLRGSRRVQKVIAKIPAGRFPGEKLATEISYSKSHVRV